MRAFWRTAFSAPIVTNAIGVALFVGTVLNAINQGSQLLAWEGVSWVHLFLNFLTPYCVATWSATQNQLRKANGRLPQ